MVIILDGNLVGILNGALNNKVCESKMRLKSRTDKLFNNMLFLLHLRIKLRLKMYSCGSLLSEHNKVL